MNVKTVCAAWLSAALIGCGGGGDATTDPLPTTPTTPAIPTLTLTGTAATGQALAEATVSVSCVTGTGTATTNANGSYTVNLANGEAPCIVTVTQPARGNAPAVSVKSITQGTEKTQRVNVTPLTHALVSYLEALAEVTQTADLLTQPAAKALLSDAAALAKRITEDFLPLVRDTLGITLRVADFLTADIVPANGNVPGNQADQDLEAFKTVTNPNGDLNANAAAQVRRKADADRAQKPLVPAVPEPTPAPTPAPAPVPQFPSIAVDPPMVAISSPTQPVSGTVSEPALTVRVDQTPGSANLPTAYSAAGSQTTFNDDAGLANHAVISSFGSNDAIAFSTDARNRVAVSSQGANVMLTVNVNGVVSSILLTGVVTAGQIVYDVASFNALPVGDIGFGGTAQALTAALDSRGGTLTNPATFDASTASFALTDDATLPSVVRISGFGADDALTLRNTTAGSVAVSSRGNDVTLLVNQGGTVSSLTLLGVMPTGGIVYDVPSFNTLPVGNVQFQ